MNDDYKRLREEANELYHRFNDTVDDRVAAAGLKEDVRNIVEYFEMNKPPRSIEGYIKEVQQQIRSLDNQASAAMDADDLDELLDGYEDLREELRELDNY
ncbi:MAG TPA: hypothetical protein VK978_02650 [Candidatus Saccharimonadales bacterium]|nr:hypothetical protein [Candidatus Saccharimonadales bacterium]